MKKLEISQMENLQGGWGKTEWCLVGTIAGVGVAVLSGPGAIGALGIVGAAATALGC